MIRKRLFKSPKLVLSSCAALAVTAYLVFDPAVRTGLAQTRSEVPAPSDPQYTKEGNLIRPKQFQNWIFVGSNLGLGYNEELTANTPRAKVRETLGEYHNIYISPEAYASYVRDKTFPDKTVLVMDVYSAETKEPQGVVTAGSFNGKSLGIEVAVKNKDRPDGQPTAWAYYNFSDRAGGGTHLPAEAPAQADANCFNCHRDHASDDKVWVQFYPTLRAIKDQH
jgi:hypothetical protein